MKDYWVLYQENNHIFHTGDNNTTQIHEIPLPPWDTAVRIISEDQKLEKYEKTKSFSLSQTPRATDCAKEKKLWNKRLAQSNVITITDCFYLYICFLWCKLSYGINSGKFSRII